MSSAVADLEAGLQAMLSLKPPGVSGSRISSLTALCQSNVQSESVLIQKLYTHFKKAPGTHKLGVLYVVDSVTRKWTEQAKANGQPISSAAQDGTYAAGVHRVTELLPVLMNDIVLSAPDDQKEKIKKLIEIWEKGQTFPLKMLTTFKDKLNEPPPKSTTPDGSPPRDLQSSLVMQPSATTPAAASSILAALANISRQNTSATASAPSIPAQDISHSFQSAQSNHAQQMASMNPTYPFTSSTQPVNVPMPTANFAQQLQPQTNGAQNFLSNQPPAFGAFQAPLLATAAVDPALQQQIMILKTLADQGIPQDKWGGIIAALTAASSNGAAPQFQAPQPIQGNGQNGWGSANPEESRDRSGNGSHEALRSPTGRYRRRSRSPSPQRGWTARDSPNSRREHGYGDHDRNSPRGRGDDRSRARGNDYRQRSPPARRGRSPSPPPRNLDYGRVEKWIEYDPALGSGNVKVLSRTLFVGGVTTSEQDLRSIFDRFGQVQTCIVNKEKRHAFVKMITRKDAVAAKEAMEVHRNPDSQLRTRWGVGFGPRDCCDYTTGISIIPISKLTDADRKWFLTAEYGGSGGKQIEGGMVVEEPDIEIGQGVSSKAISRRMQTDRGGSNGPRSTRDQDEEPSRFRRPDGRNEARREEDRYGRDADRGTDRSFDRVSDKSQVPLPFQMSAMPLLTGGLPGYPPFTLPAGMSFPPGFMFPGAPGQPPPPGRN